MSEASEQEKFELEKAGSDSSTNESGPKSASAPVSSSDMRNPETLVRTDPATGEVADSASSPTDNIQDQMQRLKAERDKYKDIALRSVADLDNYRKRMAREKDDAIRFANANFLERLIPILDNFELGLQAAKASGGQSAVVDGMSMVSRQLQDFLTSCGIETIDAIGQVFNPNIHEAIAQEENAEIEEGHVIRQVRKGYRLKDRLIRPANVVVSKGVSVGADSAKAGATT
jgi:molecular chaperone GrpE